jgi:hypothetical protein
LSEESRTAQEPKARSFLTKAQTINTIRCDMAKRIAASKDFGEVGEVGEAKEIAFEKGLIPYIPADRANSSADE